MYIFANWKMYLGHADALDLARTLTRELRTDHQIVLFPNPLSVTDVQEIIAGTDMAIGAQNVAWAPQGAYTGATSALMYKEAGCTYALVGHSERRYIFGETNDAVRKKIEACLEAGLIPVLCIGETTEDRAEDKTEYRIKKQLFKALDTLDIPPGMMMIAYEPVWAITGSGTGEPCDPIAAAEMHSLIKREVKQYTDVGVPVLYGGSTTAENVVRYTSLVGIDGVLVGHASTQAKEFSALVQAVCIK